MGSKDKQQFSKNKDIDSFYQKHVDFNTPDASTLIIEWKGRRFFCTHEINRYHQPLHSFNIEWKMCRRLVRSSTFIFKNRKLSGNKVFSSEIWGQFNRCCRGTSLKISPELFLSPRVRGLQISAAWQKFVAGGEGLRKLTFHHRNGMCTQSTQRKSFPTNFWGFRHVGAENLSFPSLKYFICLLLTSWTSTPPYTTSTRARSVTSQAWLCKVWSVWGKTNVLVDWCRNGAHAQSISKNCLQNCFFNEFAVCKNGSGLKLGNPGQMMGFSHFRRISPQPNRVCFTFTVGMPT